MTFNGQRNNDVYLLEGRSKSPYHPVNREITRIGKRHRLRKTRKDLLPISQPIGFVASEDQAKIDTIERLTDWLITEDWGILSFDDEPGRSYEAVLQNGIDDFEKMVSLRQGTLNFIAKSTLGSNKTINVTTTSQQHEITGQTKTPWTIEVLFEENTNRFEFWAGDIYLHLNYQFIAGDRLTIHYTGREVWLRDRDLRTAVSMSSHFEELQPRLVSMRASHECEIKYTERFY